MTELIAELKKTKGYKALKSLPRSMSAASTQLKDLAEPLLNQGVVVKELPRTSNKRLWEIYHESLADSVQGSTDVSNDDDDLQDYFGDSLSLEESPEESPEE